MPILASIVRTGPQIVMPDPDVRRLEFSSIDGTDILVWDEAAFIIASGIQGLDVPPRRITSDTYPGLDGARVRDISTGPRTVVLPFYVSSDDRQVQTLLEQKARVRRFFDYRTSDYAANEGTFDLIATQQDRGAPRRLRCLYVDGMDGLHGIRHSNGPAEATFDTKLLAVQPYWRGEEWSTPTVGLPIASPFLSSDPGDAWPRQLAPSVAIGADMPLAVPGDVPSPAVVELTGPATSTHITSPAGLDVTIGPLGTGDFFVLDTGRTKRALLNGADDWEKVGPSPRWRPMPPGQTTISIEMTGSGPASRARVHGDALWETAW